MSSSVSFVGAGFSLESVVQLSPSTIRVRFTQDPIAVDPAGLHDALNLNNYGLSGPSNNSITGTGVVDGDSQSIDLFTSAPLMQGVWTVTASNAIQTTNSSSLTNPISFQFTAAASPAQEPPAAGAENDDAEAALHKFLNPALVGPGWDALVAAIATGEQANYDNARLAFDQLFMVSASGIYLERKAGDNGIEKPVNLGMLDNTFRQYAIKLTNGKLVENSILDILEVFYGSDSVRASSDTASFEPFFLQDGDDLTVLFNEQEAVLTILQAADFAIIGQAKALEVAAALTRSFTENDTNAWAQAEVDPETGKTGVRIYSGTHGLSSSVRITGGKAQNALNYPTNLPLATGLPVWVVTVNATTGRSRFACTTGTDLSQLRVGDYVNVFGAEFDEANRGSFPVVNVAYSYPGGTIAQYFEIENLGVNQTVTQGSAHSLLYFRPTRTTVHTTGNRAVIASTPGDGLDILLPATSGAVGRSVNTAAYVQQNPALAITSAERIDGVVTITTTAVHGIQVGAQVFIDGTYGDIVFPAIVTGSGSSSDRSKGSIWSTTTGTAAPAAAVGGVAVTLIDGRVFHGQGYALASNTRADTITNWGVLTVSQEVEQPDGSILATYRDIAGGAAPYERSFAGASLGINPTWFFGSVVVTGGQDSTHTATHETSIYSPDTLVDAGTYVDFGRLMNFKRQQHAQVTLNNLGHAYHGGFFVMGGINETGTTVNTCERYSPVEGAAGGWAIVTSMLTPRYGHQAISLLDGRVLVVGGHGLNTCEIYDPTANTWAVTGNMTYTRFNHRLAMLPDGRVLVIGGTGYDPALYSGATPPVLPVEMFDPATGRWSSAGSLQYPHDLPVVAVVGAEVYVTGGSDAVGGIKTEVFNSKSFRWTVSPAVLSAARPGAVGAVVARNNIALFGGSDNTSHSSASYLSLFIPNAETFFDSSLNGLVTVTSAPSSNTFTYAQPGHSQYMLSTGSTGTATPARALSTSIPGPISFDLSGGVAITTTETTLSATLNAGQRYGSIMVADATQFPDAPGFLCFRFGYANQVAPVPYYGRLSDTSLSIDYSFKFPATVQAGGVVSLLFEKGTYTPATPTTIGSFYATASSAGRIAAQNSIDGAVASGVSVTQTIVYPGDRGLGGEGLPASGNYKLSDKVGVWGGDEIDAEIAAARKE